MPLSSKEALKIFSRDLFFFIAVLAFCLGCFYYVGAFSDAPGTPPTCPAGYPGCDAPLNTGTSYQTKTGILQIKNPDIDYSDNLGGNWFISAPVAYDKTFDQAKAYCAANSARLAYYSEIVDAYKNGASVCAWGWIAEGFVVYPMQNGAPGGCGGPVGGVRVYYAPLTSTFAAYCARDSFLINGSLASSANLYAKGIYLNSGQSAGSMYLGLLENSSSADKLGICLNNVCKTSWDQITGPWTISGNNIYSNNSGNVGIGTTNPTFRLDVRNSANTAESVPLMVRNSGTYGAGWRSSIGFGNALNDTILSEISSVGVDGSNIDLRFSTYGSGVKTDVVTFQGGGNVGIGTASPSSGLKLDVEGKAGATDFCDKDGNNCYSTAESYSFYVGGDTNTFYPVFFPRKNYYGASVAQFLLSRTDVHENGSWKGSFHGEFKFGLYNWGHTSSFFDYNIRGNTGNNGFVANPRVQCTGNSLVLYLRGNSGYYFYNIRDVDNPVIYLSGTSASECGSTINYPSLAASAVTQIYGSRTNDNGGNYVIGGGNVSAAGSITAGSGGFCLGTVCKTSWNDVGGYWQDGGSGRIYYNNGNVGIGTTGPQSKLHVYNSPYNYKDIIVDSAAPAIRFADTENHNSFGIFGDSQLYFSTYPYANRYDGNYGSILMTLSPGGNVGIGTTSPSQKLDVNGSQNISGGLAVSGGAVLGDTTSGHYYFKGTGADSGQAVSYYGIYQESGPWTNPYPDLRIQYHTGIKYDAYYGYGGHRFYTGYDGTGNPAGLTMSIGDGDQNVRVINNLYVGGGGSFGQPVSVGTPTSASHATTKGYVDSVVAGGVGGVDQSKWTQSGGNLYPKNISSNVGIGITPISWAKLDVNGGLSVRGPVGGLGTAVITSEAGGTGLTLKARGGDYPDLTIATNGNVGIGTVNPYGKLNINGGHLNLGGTSDPAYDQGNNWLTWGYRADNNPYYAIRTQYKTYGSYTYSRLQLNWYTGIEIGAHPVYGGVRFFDNSPGMGANQIFSVGDSDSNVRVVNNLYVGGGGSFGQPITVGAPTANTGPQAVNVDYLNTRLQGGGGGLVNANQCTADGTCETNNIAASGGASINTMGSTWGGWNEAIRFSNGSHAAITYPAGGLLFGMHSNRNMYWADTNNGWYSMYLEPTGNLVVRNAVYAPSYSITGSSYGAGSIGFLGKDVYADTLNTGVSGDPLEINYYRQGDVKIGNGPAGGSNLWVGGNITATGDVCSGGRCLSSVNNSLTGAYTPRYQAWASQGTGDGGAAIYNDNTSFRALMVVGSDQGQGYNRWVRVWDSLWVNSRMDAPIYYDSNDTGYYVDPNSTSRVNRILTAGRASDWGATGEIQGNYLVANTSLYSYGGICSGTGSGDCNSAGQITAAGQIDANSASGSGGYISSGNYGGTGAAAYFPQGIWANGSNSWIYGYVSFNGILTDNASRWQINPSTGMKAADFCTNGGKCLSTAGSGTITGVTPGTGLTGGGTSGNVTLSLDNNYVLNNLVNNQGFIKSGSSVSSLTIGKLNVTTIDPVYEIDGKKYATYVSDFAGGVRTETSGLLKLETRIPNTEKIPNNENPKFQTIINFDELQKGSDLWLFWQASNKNIFDLVVILTPGFDGKVWYKKQDNKLIIFGEKSGEVSYRLTLPREDAGEWPNLIEKK